MSMFKASGASPKKEYFRVQRKESFNVACWIGYSCIVKTIFSYQAAVAEAAGLPVRRRIVATVCERKIHTQLNAGFYDFGFGFMD